MSRTPRGLEERRNADGKFGNGRLPLAGDAADERAAALADDPTPNSPELLTSDEIEQRVADARRTGQIPRFCVDERSLDHVLNNAWVHVPAESDDIPAIESLDVDLEYVDHDNDTYHYARASALIGMPDGYDMRHGDSRPRWEADLNPLNDQSADSGSPDQYADHVGGARDNAKTWLKTAYQQMVEEEKERLAAEA